MQKAPVFRLGEGSLGAFISLAELGIAQPEKAKLLASLIPASLYYSPSTPVPESR